MMKPFFAHPVVRFFITACVGLILDLGIATALILAFAFSDPLAATIGLFAGMIFNYFTHLLWTFQHRNRAASLKHFLQFSVGVGITLIVRIGFLQLLDHYGAQSVLHPTARLAIAAAVSFVLSYLICNRFIFSDETR